MEKKMKRKWLLLFIITITGFFLDWYTKHLAQAHLVYATPVRVAGDYLQLLLIYNKGALFGFNPRTFFASFPVNHFFIIFTILAVVMLILYYRSLSDKEIGLHWGVMMIFPGAFGNLFDRIIHPNMGVVDFIRIGIPDKLYWPIFNFADIYVSVGIVIMMFTFLTEDKRKKERQALKNITDIGSKENSLTPESSVSDNVR